MTKHSKQIILTAILWINLVFLLMGSVYANQKKDVDFEAVTQEMLLKGDQLVQNYQPDHNAIDTGDEFSNLYFDVFEASGMETAIGMSQPKLKTSLEVQFSQIIGYAMKNTPKETLNTAWEALKSELLAVAKTHTKTQSNQESGFWSVLLQAFFILLREGFEAILVITALIAYLKRSAPDKVTVIWYGIGVAIVASLLTAWAFHTVVQLSGTDREAMEGITMLLAAGVLFYVSYWLISKRESARWQKYINGKIDQAVSTGGLFTLAFAAFLAVYREGAETVLFYQALSGSINGQYMALLSGIALASLVLGLLYWIMYKTSVKLPMGLFFTATAILLYYLAFTFIGKGILELQAARWISTTPYQWLPHIEWLGMFPNWETFSAQVVFLLPLPLAWYILHSRSNHGAVTSAQANKTEA